MLMQARKRAIDKVHKRRDRYDIPDWQRESVWSRSQKQALIDTVLRGWRLPKFYFLKTAEEPDEFEVVDGQQRLLAIFEFYDDDLALSAPSAKEFGAERYSGLPEPLQDAFDDYEIEYDEITDASEQDIKLFFQRLQGGLRLTSSEQLNAVHSKLRDFVRALAKHSFLANKVAVSSKRYAHFDIAAKVAAIEIEGIGAGLRFDDLRATFESQASFSPRSQVAQRLRSTFDYLDTAFPDRATWLRNRTVVQAYATLVARLLASGNCAGTAPAVGSFLTAFHRRLGEQVMLGQHATDSDYTAFQKTVSANVRRGAQVRQEVLLRKLLQHDPAFADALGSSAVAESGVARALEAQAGRIRGLVRGANEEYGQAHGSDLFKLTNRTTDALQRLGEAAHDLGGYRDWVDRLYYLFREGVGTRLIGRWPASFMDVNALRTSGRHDVDHGEQAKVRAKRRRLGDTFRRYSGAATPETLAPERFVLVQSALLTAIEADLRKLKVT